MRSKGRRAARSIPINPGLAYGAYAAATSDYGYKSGIRDWKDVAPRAGFTYNVGGHTEPYGSHGWTRNRSKREVILTFHGRDARVTSQPEAREAYRARKRLRTWRPSGVKDSVAWRRRMSPIVMKLPLSISSSCKTSGPS